ncbi:MAG: QueT transporter family protein [Ruminococcaceae bacterium]|nr:QueT transporter family protein [Oscillospiraceae bacterium]
MNKRVKYISYAALIAALYMLLTYIAAAMGLSSGAVQIRFSEALCVLPYFTAAAVPGVTIGCLLANIITGCALWDIVFGTVATLIGAVLARLLRKNKWLVPLPSVLSNVTIVPFVLMFVYNAEEAYPLLLLTVGAGEVISIYGLGMLLLTALEKRRIFI